MLFIVLQRHEQLCAQHNPLCLQSQHNRQCKASVRTFMTVHRDPSVLQRFSQKLCAEEVKQWCRCSSALKEQHLSGFPLLHVGKCSNMPTVPS